MAEDWFEHFVILRRYLLGYGISFMAVCLPLLYYASQWYGLVLQPIIRYVPSEQLSFIATSVTAPFVIPLKLALVSAFLLTAPFLLLALWKFIASGLYHHERRLYFPYLIASACLFYFGVALAYWVVCPMAFAFFYTMSPAGVQFMPDIAYALQFVLSMCFAFGVCFQLPVIIWFVLATGLVSADTLSSARPYVIVASFVVGMLLTPPDVLSQIMLATPICLLYELALRLAPKQAASPSHSLPESEHQ